MKIAVLIARSVLGLVYLAFGLDYFFNFLSHFINFPSAGPKADAFFGALVALKYFFSLLKTIEIICGFFLLINRYTLFFLIAVFPITVNIFAFHVFATIHYWPLGTGMLLLNLFLIYDYRKYYMSIFLVSQV
jgi:putative oxidoreductase